MNQRDTSTWPRLLAALLVIFTGPEAEKLTLGFMAASLNLLNNPAYENWILHGRVAAISTAFLLLFSAFWASTIVWSSVMPAWIDRVAVIVGFGIAILAVIDIVQSFPEVVRPWRLVGFNGLLAAYFAVSSLMIHWANVDRDNRRFARDKASGN